MTPAPDATVVEAAAAAHAADTTVADRTRVDPAGGRPADRDPRSVTVPYGAAATPDAATRASTERRSAAGAPPRRPARPGPGDRRGGGPRTPRGGDDLGPGGRGGSRRPLLIGGGGVLALALAGGGAALALRGGDDPTPSVDAASAGPDEGVQSPTSTTVAQATTTTLPPGPFVNIDEVVLVDGRYRVDYRVTGYTPEVDGGPESLHIHFFLDTTDPRDAGTNGNPPGEWELTDEPSSYLTDYTPGNAGGTMQMCSAVATVDHAVHLPDTPTGNCVDLPA